MSVVYALYLVACMEPYCHYVMPARAYANELSCQLNAAMIAGMKRAEGNRPVQDGFNYRYECRPVRKVAVQAPPSGRSEDPAPAASRV